VREPIIAPRESSSANAQRTPVWRMCSSAGSIVKSCETVIDARSRKSVITVSAGSEGSANQGSVPGIGRLGPSTVFRHSATMVTS